ncbi:two-component system, chemotaxis family, sensor kinase CheA [Sphingomonas guangdongensis]|uniref:Chemotaxis protein CheA n=1 Tax=Sphingomonas guangdongensis TaxID=1141890 RepID=A0A285R5J9_9SPHN|nr:chemotaxis protein CheA [Sphingomonas guangdongensis]SOB87632.1 two-component system, chemotaxis family, sensor kinase CheA [Sphingomonas guangdongensis]
MDELLQEFIAETRETLDALGGEIVAWEADPSDRARLDAIFRFVHTVKGSCGFLDLPRLARLSHAAEDVLAAVREGTRAPDRALVDAVLAIVDRIGQLVEAIEGGVSLDDSGEDELIAALAEGSLAAAPVSVGIASRAPSRSVRLNVELLDLMMSGMSDMVLARNELARRLRVENPDPDLEAALERLSATVAEMRDTVTRTRMQKIESLFSALPRMVRDTAAAVGKSVSVHVEGSEVELDREMIEVMRDPLVHIIRNSIDHGIEVPAERRRRGKRENGRLCVSARQSGNQIVLEIADDGAGIDVDRVIAKLVRNGARDERELRQLSDKAKLDLIFEPGLSTKDEVTEISGRGVGMDVVRAALEQIGGRIELDSVLGRGLTITIHVPLTLSIIPTIICGVGDQHYAIPRQAIEEIVSEGAESIRVDRLGGGSVVRVRDRRLPLVDLSERLAIPSHAAPGGRMLAIVTTGTGSFAVAVDQVLDAEELVIKPAAPAIMACGLFAGQTLPDTGKPMLMIDCAGLASDAGLSFVREAMVDDEPAAAEVSQPPALLFRDLDGEVRAIPLAVVDRVDGLADGLIGVSAGKLRLTTDGQIVPLAAFGAWQDRANLSVLRLRDGTTEIGYAIVEPLDIVTLPAEVLPPITPGVVAGTVLINDAPVELVDPHWLFATLADAAPLSDPAARPLCLIDPEDSWLESFVRPMLERSGYRVAATAAPGETPVATICTGPSVINDNKVVRLRPEPTGHVDSIYRYDREAILAAVAVRASALGSRT